MTKKESVSKRKRIVSLKMRWLADRRCVNCSYFMEVEDPVNIDKVGIGYAGECRLRPPTVKPTAEDSEWMAWDYVRVWEDDWCGQYEKRPKLQDGVDKEWY